MTLETTAPATHSPARPTPSTRRRRSAATSVDMVRAAAWPQHSRGRVPSVAPVPYVPEAQGN